MSRATFLSSRAADELRERTAFAAMRLLRVAVFRRCALVGSPPALDRRRIAAPQLRTRHRGEVRLARWSIVRHNIEWGRCGAQKHGMSQKLSKCFWFAIEKPT